MDDSAPASPWSIGTGVGIATGLPIFSSSVLTTRRLRMIINLLDTRQFRDNGSSTRQSPLVLNKVAGQFFDDRDRVLADRVIVNKGIQLSCQHSL